MTTRELIEKLPENVVWYIEQLRRDYKKSTYFVTQVRAEIYGYTTGLRDAGLVNERERQMLFMYATC